MLKTITTIALLTFGAPAFALDCGDLLMPPPQYNHVLAPGDLTIKIMDLWEVQIDCKLHGLAGDQDGRKPIGCSFGATIVLPTVGVQDVTLDEQRCVFFHERAHLWPNSWPADHPDAVYW